MNDWVKKLMFQGISPSTNRFFFPFGYFAACLQGNFECLTERIFRSFLKLANTSPLILCGELASVSSRHRAQARWLPVARSPGKGTGGLERSKTLTKEQEPAGQQRKFAHKQGLPLCPGTWLIEDTRSEFGRQPDSLGRPRGKKDYPFVCLLLCFSLFFPLLCIYQCSFLALEKSNFLLPLLPGISKVCWLKQNYTATLTPPGSAKNIKPPEARLRTSLGQWKKVKWCSVCCLPRSQESNVGLPDDTG